jgi:hypothetical protein
LSFDDLVTGTVIRYPYLWSRDASRGETEGRKPQRPTVVGFRIPRHGGRDLVLLFPITSKAPGRSRLAVEIPAMEKHRAGLNTDHRLWIVFDEFNEDVIGESFYLDPDPPLGRLSRAFLLPLLHDFIARRAAIRGVRRGP